MSGASVHASASGPKSTREATKLLGLTGSVGMGKSTVASMFRELGIAVMDADAVRASTEGNRARDETTTTRTVHELYAPNGAAVAVVREMFGDQVVDASGGVDRRALGEIVIGDAEKMAALERAVHPLVDRAREDFVASREGDVAIVFDIPLLYEKGYETTMDAVCVVSTGCEKTQRARVLGRDGMTPEKFEGILARQMPDAEKRARADYVIDTSLSLEETRARVEEVLRAVVERPRVVYKRSRDLTLVVDEHGALPLFDVHRARGWR
ncbi:dephospho-CoA kinase [Ostreococcus tauri]|uniref:Dephospho-CoA kinase n=1 Tax=Ostreococcus tauri TaxID=70448 RepID=A0A1Y5I444_OSTTA|nr:dephospho-CoA kinase [Ostreococcus tauri]